MFQIIAHVLEILIQITNILWSTPPPRIRPNGRSEFWNKIVHFGFYDLKKFLVEIWDRPDLPARYWPIPGHYRPIF